MLFRDGNEKIEISESIKDALLNELIQEIKKKKPNNDKYEKYFFEDCERLKKFVLLYIFLL